MANIPLAPAPTSLAPTPLLLETGLAGASGTFGAWRSLMLMVALVVAPASVAPAQKGKRPAYKPPKIVLPESVRQPKPVEMQVAPVDPGRRAQALAAASEIDRLVDRLLQEKRVAANPPASDEVFLRRVYLDVAGRIPTLQETRAFLDASADPAARRAALIDHLLDSPDYVFNFYNFWADVLRLTERPQSNIIADPYLAYVKDSIRQNKPYDRWVYEMLTAEGKIWDNPAVGFQLRDDGQPLPYVDNTVRVFLGTQIGCAQCHDHPFDNWTQHQFYQLAAYTAGTRTRIDGRDPEFKKGNVASQLINEARESDPKRNVSGEFQRLVRANTYRVAETPRALRLPHDYAYSDHKPGDVVPPAVLWDDVPASAADATPRQQFAAWLTSPDNQQFSRTIANRLWKRLLGVGLVEPIDDFNDSNPSVHPELLEFLSREMVRLDFDLKEFIRVILNSRTYQRESTAYELTSGEPYYFPGPALRRMTAEQVWDSILTLALYNPVPFQRPTAEEMAPVLDLDFLSVNLPAVKQAAEKFRDTYYMSTYKRQLNQHGYKGAILCRASELPLPLPADHFLRQFGQGDRETINGGQTGATVPQIMTMFNGPITHVMLETGSRIYDDVERVAADKREAMDVIFLSVLSRRGSITELRTAISEVTAAERPGIGYGNVIWALLNTREFLFIQ